jgi:hypothetical protein
MHKQLITIAGIGAALLGCLFLPFLPGEYDGLAVGIATMAVLFGFGGLLLVPVGLTWLGFEIFKACRVRGEHSHSRAEYYFAVTALICSLPVIALISIGAWATVGTSAALIFIAAVLTFVARRVFPQLRKLCGSEGDGFNAAPLYLLVLPALVVVTVLAWGRNAERFSRERAMANAAP